MKVEGVERSSDSLAVALGQVSRRRRRPSPLRGRRGGSGHHGRRRRCGGTGLTYRTNRDRSSNSLMSLSHRLLLVGLGNSPFPATRHR